MARYRVGVDVGGTNTDAAIIDITKTSNPTTRGVRASHKLKTTTNVTDGIEAAVRKVIADAGVDPQNGEILSLTIGTTHFINAVVQADARKLSKVAVIRLAAPYTFEHPPCYVHDSLWTFPPHLKSLMDGHTAIINGGLQIDGRAINEIDKAEVIEQAKQIKSKGLKDIVLIGPGICYFHELGPEVKYFAQVGFIERENASILNASIGAFARQTIRRFENAMKRLGLACPLYLTQNDGTLTSAADAAKLPIRTFSSGATNSMRGSEEGAAKVSSWSMWVAQTTDIGVLLPSGFPRQAAAFIEVAEVRTNFSMPDINSIGLAGRVTVGPDSIGHQLTSDAKVFGGQTLTATDIAVRFGAGGIGDATKVADISNEVVTKARMVTTKLLENAVDRMKTSPEDCTVLLVGGGSILVPLQLKGVQEVIIPPFHDVANAVGAAIAKVSGDVDTIEIVQSQQLSEILKPGADLASVSITEINILPVQYVTNQATRISDYTPPEINTVYQSDLEEEPEPTQETILPGSDGATGIDYLSYRPKITDLFFIQEGCGVLGTGGGGNPYPTYLKARQILREGKTIRIVDHSSLADDAVAHPWGYECFMGSPSVGSERLTAGADIMEAGKELAKFCGVSSFAATLCNGMQSLVMAGLYAIPAFDGDLMGRGCVFAVLRFPSQLALFPAVYDRPNALIPCALCDGDDNVILLTKVKNEHMVETLMRTVTTEMGSSAALCCPPLAVSDARDYGVPRTHSQAWRIGKAIPSVVKQGDNMTAIPDAILELQNGICLFVGKIVNCSREVRAGFTWGEIRIARLRDEELEAPSVAVAPDHHMVIPFQNENLCAYIEEEDSSRTLAAIVPDLISVLDSQSGSNLGSQDLIAMAGSPLWRSDAGLRAGGPAAFGFEHSFTPIGEYITPRSVIDEYR
ncbi:Hydantoinase/oxoprolinase [Mycena olivaceomarginata]|nr:Hydantoinase/oxoprolinase [Mycena olivaceomarginata]